MKFGRLAHSAILEADNFLSRYVIKPKFDRRTRLGKEEDEIFEAALAADAIVVTVEERDIIVGMIESIRRHDIAMGLISGALPEQSIYYQHPRFGIPCKARPDLIQRRGQHLHVADLKTAADGSWEHFWRAIKRDGYHIQGAWYQDAVELLLEQDVHSYNFIAVEKEPPYEVAVYTLDEETLAKGRRECARAAELFARCQQADLWPGVQYNWETKSYYAQNISLPYWDLED